MNQTEAAKVIADRINATEGFAAKVRLPGKDGSVRVDVTKDSGGKKGWQSAGSVVVASELDFSEIEFAFRYDKDALAAVKAELVYQFESPAQKTADELASENLAAAARAFRAGKIIAEDLVVECVLKGFLTQAEAMNRDW